MEKTCSHCNKTKECDVGFYASPRSRDGYTSWCKLCTCDSSRFRKHGITRADYEAILERQGGRCAICGTPEPPFGEAAFQIDHDHSCCPGEYSCGQCVRGLLCGRCNRALGLFLDDPEVLRSALRYLKT